MFLCFCKLLSSVKPGLLAVLHQRLMIPCTLPHVSYPEAYYLRISENNQ